MNTSIRYDEPHVLETIIEKYKKQNEALEKRESDIINILANMRKEQNRSSEIEERIKTAILSSKNFNNEIVVSGDRKLRDPGSSVYPTEQLVLARERMLPRSRYSRFDTGFDFEVGSRSIDNTSRRKCPRHNVNPCSERVLNWSHNAIEDCEPLKYHSYETVKHSYGRDGACERILDLVPRRFDERFQPAADDAFGLPYEEFLPTSPSIQDILNRYARTRVDRLRQEYDDECRVNAERRWEGTQRGGIFPLTKSLSRRQIVTTSGNTFQKHISTLCNPYSDTTSNESVKRRKSPRPNTGTEKSRGSATSEDYPRELYKRVYTGSREIQDLDPQGESINDDLEQHCVDCEAYEFDENYSNNYLTFLIRNCLPRSLLKGQYSSSYNWSSENKEDILTKTEEIDIIKEIMCEELDYRESIEKPFKIHREDRKDLLRNIMYAEAVKLGLSKGLPICGVMALFGETRSAENARQLTLQTIRQANELLGEHHSDPVGLEDILAAAASCADKLETFRSTNTSSKLTKILQDVIAREPILDPHATLQKCIEDLQNLEGVDEAENFDESDSLRSEVCRLKNIIWSVEEYNIMRALRGNDEVNRSGGSQSEKSVVSARIDIESRPTTREETFQEGTSDNKRQTLFISDSLVIEHAGLKREIKQMKSIVLNLENNSTPRETYKKKDIERVSKRRNNTPSDTNTIPRVKPAEEVRCKRQEIKNTTSSAKLQTNPSKDSAVGERDTLKMEVNRLKLLVESMEQRLIMNRDTKNPPQDASVTTNVDKVNTDNTEANENNTKNTTQISKVFYLVKNKGDKSLEMEKNPNKNSHTHTKAISCEVQRDNDNHPITINSQMPIQKGGPSIIITCQREGIELDKIKHAETIATQTSDAAFCKARAVEQAVTKSGGQRYESPKTIATQTSDAAFCEARAVEQAVTKSGGQLYESPKTIATQTSDAAFCKARAVEQAVKKSMGQRYERPETIATQTSDTAFCKARAVEQAVTKSGGLRYESPGTIATQTSDTAFCKARAVEQAVTKSGGQLYESPETIATQTSDTAFCETRAIEQAVRKSGDVARHPLQATETRSTQTLNKSISAGEVRVNNKTTCVSNKPSETEANNMIPTRRNVNSAENMWKNMVDAVIPSVSSTRSLSWTSAEGGSSSKAVNNLSEAAVPCCNNQSEESIFKIIHKSGSAYEICSALSLDDQTTCRSTNMESTSELIDDLSQQLTHFVNVCTGTDTRHCLEKIINESYVAKYEKAINETLKQIINSYPPPKDYGSRDSPPSTTQTDSPSHYTDCPSFTSVITYAPKKKNRPLNVVKNETSNNRTMIDYCELSEENNLLTEVIEKEPSLKKDVPSVRSKLNTISTHSSKKGRANYKGKSSGLSKSKSHKDSSNLAARRIGTKKDVTKGGNKSTKTRNASGARKASPTRHQKPGIPFKRSDKECTKMAIASNYIKESDKTRKDSGSNRRIQQRSDEKCIINEAVSKKTPTNEEGDNISNTNALNFADVTQSESSSNKTKTVNMKKVSGSEPNSSISILFAGDNWMADSESKNNSVYLGAEETM